MAFNLIKKYNQHLEIDHLSVRERTKELKEIFDRDISNNDKFLFRKKVIRPLKKEGIIDIESLFKHLTHKSENESYKRGVVIKSRNIFDIQRSKRLHWILPHIEEKIDDDVSLFSANNRIRGKNIIRTYLFNKKEEYVIILEPQRSGMDYYLITAYYLEKKYGGPKSIGKKYKNRLPQVY